MEHVDIAIVGGGMVGLSLAVSLQQSGLTAAIINKAPFEQMVPEAPLLRVSAINCANSDKLTRLGVWQRMPVDRVSPYTTMDVWDKDSFGRIQFSCDELPAPALGHIVENQVLTNALAQQVEEQAHCRCVEASISKLLVGQQETMVMLDNDEVIACKLLVGADGANSFIRQQLQMPLSFKDYGHTAIVATVRTLLPHKQCARQVFTPDGPLAFLPLSDPHLCSIVWSQTSAQAQRLLKLDEQAFNHALTATSNSALGVVEAVSDKLSFPLTMRYARQWVKEGAVIIGDAAHTIHPLAGQGANLGMQDAFALADTLKQLQQQGKPLGSLRYLRPFERARKADAVAMIAAMSGFKTLFAGSNPVKKLIRGMGLTATNALPQVKRRLLAEAMGW